MRARSAAAALASLAALLIGAAASAPPPPAALEPATGRFLVATPRVRGPIFGESVVFLLSYGQSESMGLIVNRPTATELSLLFPGVEPAAGALHLGGPVEPGSMLVLLRAAEPPERAHQVTGDVFVTSDESTLRAAANRPDAAGRVRVYAGYAGWGEGQLDREIARGDWIVARTPPDPIFDAAPEGLWERLYRAHHRLTAGAPRPGAGLAPRLAHVRGAW